MILIIIAAIITSVNLGLIGPVILWRRISSFGDGISHALIIAGSIQIFIKLPLILIAIISAGIFAFLSRYLSNKKNDRNLSINILSSLFVAISIFINQYSDVDTNVENILFGDILSVSFYETILLGIIFIITSLFLYINLKKLTISIFSPELSFLNGINHQKIKLLTNILIAINIAVSIKVTGILLMSAMLLIPAAISREISSTPAQMLIKSLIIALFSMIISIILSFKIDQSPSSLSVILLSLIYFYILLRKKIINENDIL